ncbi:MAG TPA: ferritin [Spirochaetota bacterium]|nr:ferritin [Spirochaetota bacterium]
MKISNKMADVISKQINKEFYSGYLYLSMAAYFESNNLSGFAHWMKIQAKEEQEHGLKFYEYVLERGGNIELFSIEKPKSDWKSPLDVFKFTYEHEQMVTEMIYNLMDFARAEKDLATEELLYWFIKEQVEEESNASKILERLEMMKDSTGGLLIIDKELGKRGE